jgi:hypothetical protein
MVIALALAIFGALLGQAASADVAAMPASALLAVLAGWPATLLLRWLLAGCGGRQGFAALSAAARDALSLLLPFALLAALAQWGLGWRAPLAFLVAALGTSAAAAAAATARLGAAPLRSALVASLWALVAGGGVSLGHAWLAGLLAGVP